jgi:S-DNA-T family DNA segregation ATPase FtsK/SpoIIIE
VTKVGFIRQQVPAPAAPEGALVVPNPAEISRPVASRPPTWVWMLLFVGGAVALMVLLYTSGARSITGGLFIFPVMLMSMVMMLRNRGGGEKKNRPSVLNDQRADYHRRLDELRDEVHAAAAGQAREIAYHHPDPREGSLLTLVGTPRMWERTADKSNFGHVRLGVGVTRLKKKLTPPVKVPPPEYRETTTAVAARDFLLAQNVVHDIPRPLHLFDQIGWSFFDDDGDHRDVIQGTLRALVCQLCVFHGPDAIQVAIVTDDLQSWEWAKWLPHTADHEFVDASGPSRLIFGDVAGFMGRFGEQLRQRERWAPLMEGTARPDSWLVVVVDYPGANCAPILDGTGFKGVSVLEATGDQDSLLANADCAFIVDEVGNLLKAAQETEIG